MPTFGYHPHPDSGAQPQVGLELIPTFDDAEHMSRASVACVLRVRRAWMRLPSTPSGAVETLRAIERTVSRPRAGRTLQELLACREF
jgi:hypothetical protein